jgi:hypothetical protein
VSLRAPRRMAVTACQIEGDTIHAEGTGQVDVHEVLIVSVNWADHRVMVRDVRNGRQWSAVSVDSLVSNFSVVRTADGYMTLSELRQRITEVWLGENEGAESMPQDLLGEAVIACQRGYESWRDVAPVESTESPTTEGEK